MRTDEQASAKLVENTTWCGVQSPRRRDTSKNIRHLWIYPDDERSTPCVRFFHSISISITHHAGTTIKARVTPVFEINEGLTGYREPQPTHSPSRPAPDLGSGSGDLDFWVWFVCNLHLQPSSSPIESFFIYFLSHDMFGSSGVAKESMAIQCMSLDSVVQ